MTTYEKIDEDHYKVIDEQETPLTLSVLKLELANKQAFNDNVRTAAALKETLPLAVQATIILAPIVETQSLIDLIYILEHLPGDQ